MGCGDRNRYHAAVSGSTPRQLCCRPRQVAVLIRAGSVVRWSRDSYWETGRQVLESPAAIPAESRTRSWRLGCLSAGAVCRTGFTAEHRFVVCPLAPWLCARHTLATLVLPASAADADRLAPFTSLVLQFEATTAASRARADISRKTVRKAGSESPFAHSKPTSR